MFDELYCGMLMSNPQHQINNGDKLVSAMENLPLCFLYFGMASCFNHIVTQWKYQLVMKKLKINQKECAHTFLTQFCNQALLNYRKVFDIWVVQGRKWLVIFVMHVPHTTKCRRKPLEIKSFWNYRKVFVSAGGSHWK